MENFRPVKLAVNICCWATEDINWAESKHCKVFAQYPQGPFNVLCQDTPCLEELPLLTAFSKYVSVWWKYKSRRGRPVNFMTKLQQHWPMQCQWNTERVSHFHQGSQHWESWNSQKLGHHHRGQTRSAYQATALDNWGVSPQRQDTERMSSYRFRYNNDGPWNASGTRSAYPTVTRVANTRSPGPKIGASPQRRDTVRVSSYRFRYTKCQPMQCQWNKERLSHHHQGSQQLPHKMASQQRHM